MRAARPILLPLALLALLGLSLPGDARDGKRGGPVAPPGAVPATNADPLPAHALARLGTARFRIGDYPRGAGLSADGKVLVLGTSRGLVHMDAVTGKEIRQVGPMYLGFQFLALRPDGKQVATTGYNNIIQLWDVANGQPLRQFRSPDAKQRLNSVTFSGDGKYLAAGMEDFSRPQQLNVYAWESDTGKQLGPFPAIQNNRVQVAFAPDGKVLATFGTSTFAGPGMAPNTGQVIQVWDTATAKELHRLQVDRGMISSVALSPDGKLLAATSGKSSIYLWDVASGKELRRFAGRRGLGKLLEFSPDGQFLVAGAPTGSVQIWDTKSWKRHDGDGPACQLQSVSFPAPGQVLACGVEGQSVLVWDALTGKRRAAGPGHEAMPKTLTFLPEHQQLLSVDGNGRFYLWDTKAGKESRRFFLQDRDEPRYVGNARYNTVALSPGAKYAAIQDASSGNGVRLWDLQTRTVVCDFEGPLGYGQQTGLAFSLDGQLLAGLGIDTSVYVWDVTSGQERHKFKINKGPANSNANGGRVAFTADGKRLAVSCAYFNPNANRMMVMTCVWEMATGKELFRLEQPFGSLPALAFAPDGKTLALSSGAQPGILLYDAVTGKELRTLTGIPAAGLLRYAPDGRTLVAVPFTAPGQLTSIYLIEVASGQVRCQFTGHQGGVQDLAYAPANKVLVSGGNDTTILLWDLTGSQLARAQGAPAGKQLEILWTDLASTTGAQPHQAMGRLIAFPASALELLKKNLQPAKGLALGPDAVPKLIEDLDAPAFKVREKASHTLQQLGKPILRELQGAFQKTKSLEVQQRLGKIISHLEQESDSPKALQESRAVEVLERIATPEARELLTTLAGGARGALLTEQAQLSLERLKSGG
jgi:WD40 repeat protein